MQSLILICLSIWLSCPLWAKNNHQSPSLERLESEIVNKNANDRTYKDLAALIEAEPNNARARLLLASCYEQLGLPALALEEYQVAYKADPLNLETAAALFNAQLKALHTAEAIQVLNESDKRYKNSSELLNFLATYLFGHNEPGMPRRLYQRVLRSKDIPVGFASALGKIELKNKNYEAALELANQDLSLNKNLALALEIKGLALCNLGRYSEASEPLKLVYADKPASAQTACAYALSLIWTGQYSYALSPALVALASAQSEQDVATAKAMLTTIFRKDNHASGQQQCNSLTATLTPKQRAQFCFSLAQVFDACNMPDQACKQYRNVLNWQADNAEAWYKLANNLEIRSHDYQQALNCYRKAQALLPDNQLIKQRTWRLEDRLAVQSNDWSWQLKDWLE